MYYVFEILKLIKVTDVSLGNIHTDRILSSQNVTTRKFERIETIYLNLYLKESVGSKVVHPHVDILFKDLYLNDPVSKHLNVKPMNNNLTRSIVITVKDEGSRFILLRTKGR